MKKLLILALPLIVSACSVDTGASVSKKDMNKLMVCKDFRDGETFQFNTNTVTNISQGIGAPTSFDIVTTTGKVMTLNSDMEDYIKCEKQEVSVDQ